MYYKNIFTSLLCLPIKEDWFLCSSTLLLSPRVRRPNDQCTFCKAGSETLLHLFWECFFVNFFWNGIANWMRNSSCSPNQDFSFLSCIGFMSDTTKLLLISSCTFNCKVSHLSHCEVSDLLLENNVPLPLKRTLYLEGKVCLRVKWPRRPELIPVSVA